MPDFDLALNRLKRAGRWFNNFNIGEVLARVYDQGANELVVHLSDRGAPLYKEETAAAKYTRLVADSSADAAPAAAPGGAATGVFDLQKFSGAAIHFVNGTSTRTTFTVQMWVWSDLGTWLLTGSTASVAPSQEVVLPVGYRLAWVRILAGAGGAGDGTVTINVAGV